MMQQAVSELEANEIHLAEIVSRLDDESPRSRLLEIANEKWLEYRDAHCDYKAAAARGIVPDWLRALESDTLTRARIADLLAELLPQEA